VVWQRLSTQHDVIPAIVWPSLRLLRGENDVSYLSPYFRDRFSNMRFSPCLIRPGLRASSCRLWRCWNGDGEPCNLRSGRASQEEAVGHVYDDFHILAGYHVWTYCWRRHH
jgi:hypothetical protein